MRPERMLLKAMQTAEKNGWDKRGFEYCTIAEGEMNAIHGVRLSHDLDPDGMSTVYLSTFDLIYSHDFTKAVWGEKPVCTNCGKVMTGDGLVCIDEDCELNGTEVAALPAYMQHLQKMVIQNDPLVYLSANA